jgi:hypothetical protein
MSGSRQPGTETVWDQVEPTLKPGSQTFCGMSLAREVRNSGKANNSGIPAFPIGKAGIPELFASGVFYFPLALLAIFYDYTYR